MALSYVGAEAFVGSLHAELKAQYPIPGCYVTNDEPAGDFGIAHFHGLVNGCANLTFDNDRIPLRYTVAHELGHALSARFNEGNSAGPLHEAFWQARGFPGTALEWQLNAIAAERIRLNSGYRLWPEECFADTFGVVNTPYGFPITEQHGIWLDQDKMRSFFKSLGPIEGDAMTPSQEAKLDRVLALLEAEGPKIWTARAQRLLDVEQGDAYNPNRAPVDPRIKP